MHHTALVTLGQLSPRVKDKKGVPEKQASTGLNDSDYANRETSTAVVTCTHLAYISNFKK
ncbi:Protein of unknown function [Pyronema omphalodes CBS 100304]|uniref:Uncharacterized protein n=1 Tax=Pyronema omphalodes (strain CBS 100304) TaxID=1076935 RepID=U4LG12_PYROM|nr:Protein of unknown function [Pyronema omphalodes CBS 100304]